MWYIWYIFIAFCVACNDKNVVKLISSKFSPGDCRTKYNLEYITH